jgi:hypothetical protein
LIVRFKNKNGQIEAASFGGADSVFDRALSVQCNGSEARVVMLYSSSSLAQLEIPYEYEDRLHAYNVCKAISESHKTMLFFDMPEPENEIFAIAHDEFAVERIIALCTGGTQYG